MKTKINTILLGITIALLIVILSLQLFGNSGISEDYVSKTIAEQKQMHDYQREIGEENIKINDDKIFNDEYSSSIIGEVENISDKTVNNVSVHITLYNNKTIVGTTTDYFSEIEPGGTRNMDAYVTGDVVFNGYTIDYVEGIIYE